MELNKKEFKALDFTFDGRAVSARKLGFGDAFGIAANGEVERSEAASIVQKCLIYSDTQEPVFASAEEVETKDADVMMAVFNEICTYSLTSFSDAEKN